ncbi:MAG: sigma 54-interacting transcriptional regulator [Myxococcota bacterium]
MFHRPRIRIGRGPMNDLSLPIQGLSVHHGTLQLKGHELTFTDHDSLTGSAWLREGSAHPIVKAQRLTVGDAVRLGDRVTLTVLDSPMGRDADVKRVDWARDASPTELGLEACAQLAELALTQVVRTDASALVDRLPGLIEAALGVPPATARLLWVGDGDRPDRLLRSGEGEHLHPVVTSEVLKPEVRARMLELIAQGGVIHHPLSPEGYRVLLTSTSEDALRTVVMVLDMPGETDASTLGAWSRIGWLTRPLLKGLAHQWQQQHQTEALQAENQLFRERQRRHYLFKEMVTDSARMREVYQQLDGLVESDRPVLIEGEAGSGKKQLVRALHHLGSRAEGLLIAQSCSDVDEAVLNVSLFGAAATDDQSDILGALELARGGTVYLDEIEHLTPLLQAKLVRVINESEIRRHGESLARAVDVRLVLSTHVPLEELVAQGRFRKDLHVALSENVLSVPPLREREADIMPLVRIFLKLFARRYDLPVPTMAHGLEEALVHYPWPGNVRELQRAVETAVLRKVGRPLTPADFGILEA